jgi:hypothetical protein
MAGIHGGVCLLLFTLSVYLFLDGMGHRPRTQSTLFALSILFFVVIYLFGGPGMPFSQWQFLPDGSHAIEARLLRFEPGGATLVPVGLWSTGIFGIVVWVFWIRQRRLATLLLESEMKSWQFQTQLPATVAASPPSALGEPSGPLAPESRKGPGP